MPTGIYKRNTKEKERLRKMIKEIGFQKGYKHTQKSKEKIKKAHLGMRYSDITKKKMSKAKSGKQYVLGKHWKLSEETIKKSWVGKKGKLSNAYKHGLTSNKDYISWLKNKRNRKKRESEGFHTFGEWELLKKQYGYICPCCKRKEPEIKLSEDHIIPLSKGGSDYIENIQPLCRSCNSKKYNKIIKYKN